MEIARRDRRAMARLEGCRGRRSYLRSVLQRAAVAELNVSRTPAQPFVVTGTLQASPARRVFASDDININDKNHRPAPCPADKGARPSRSLGSIVDQPSCKTTVDSTSRAAHTLPDSSMPRPANQPLIRYVRPHLRVVDARCSPRSSHKETFGLQQRPLLILHSLC